MGMKNGKADKPEKKSAGQAVDVSADDFVKFYREPKTLFVSDVKNLYK